MRGDDSISQQDSVVFERSTAGHLSTRDAFLLNDAPSRRRITKFENYFAIYDGFLGRLRGKKCRILEIGVQHGGSLQIWRAYLGPDAEIDINKECLKSLHNLSKKIGQLDVIIDDGSHIPITRSSHSKCYLTTISKTAGTTLSKTVTLPIKKDMEGACDASPLSLNARNEYLTLSTTGTRNRSILAITRSATS